MPNHNFTARQAAYLLGLVLLLIGVVWPYPAYAEYCELYTESFERFGGPDDFDNGTYRAEWCVNGASITTSNPCGTGNSLRLSGSAEDPIIWLYVDSEGCTEVKLEFDFAQFADTGTVVKYTTSSDTTLNCSAYIGTVAGALNVTGGVCTGAEHTVVVSGSQSVYWKFDHGANSNAIFIDNLRISLDGCDCTGGTPSHGCCETGEPGCDDPVVESCVCTLDAYCCNTEWDAQCVDEVESFGCGTCGGSGCATEFRADFGNYFQSGSVCSIFPDLFETCEGYGPYLSSGTACGDVGDYVMSFATGYPYSAAITKCLDLSAAFSASIEFSYAKNDSSLGPRIEINVDEGSFQTIWNAPYSPGAGCHEETLDLSAYVGESNVRLKFCSGSSSSNGAAFDDIDLVLGGMADHGPCETGEPGSNDPNVTACVCAVDPYCCQTAWDEMCVMEVDAYDCGDCGGYCLTEWSLDFGETAGGTACEAIPILFESCEGAGPTIGSSTACGGTGDMAMIFEPGWPYSAAITVCLDLSAASAAKLDFMYSKADGTLGPEIAASTNQGGSFTIIWSAPFNPGVGCHAACLDLGDYVGTADVRLRFSSGTMSPSGHSIDDLVLTFGAGCCESLVVDAGADAELPYGGGMIQLSGSVSGCAGNVTVLWTATNGGHIVSGADTLTPTIDAAGTYTLDAECSDGCEGSDDVEVSESSLILADLNCDGSVNSLDVDPFVLALTSAPGFEDYNLQYPDCEPLLADCDCDGSVNSLDIDPFVECLTGSCSPCP